MQPGPISLIQFNALKHHYLFFLGRIRCWRENDPKIVKKELNELGSNQFDIYTGSLSVQEILQKTSIILAHYGISSRMGLRKWLGNDGFREIELGDYSRWVIRESEDPDRLIHIHPGRKQKLVKRVKASHIKTAVMIMVALASDKHDDLAFIMRNIPQGKFYRIPLSEEKENVAADVIVSCTEFINRIRKDTLKLSPVKSINSCMGILKTLDFLASDIMYG